MQQDSIQSASSERNVASLFGQLTDWFDSNDWNYAEHCGEEESFLSAGVECKNGRWHLTAKANEELRQVYFWSVLDMNVPEERRTAVSEFITRANYGNRIGHFEMDWRDGEIRYNVSFSVADSVLTATQIDQAVDEALQGMDRHFVALMSVIYGNCEPAVAHDALRAKVKAIDSSDAATGKVH